MMSGTMTHEHARSIMWAVSTAAGLLTVVGAAASAITHSGLIALAAFVVGFTAIIGTGFALIPAWRRTNPGVADANRLPPSAYME